MAVRLEPFDDAQVAAWLATWNAANAGAFRGTGGLRRWTLATVLAHRELAEQPLLLLMLALYDADGNALRPAGELRPGRAVRAAAAPLRRAARWPSTAPGLPEPELDRAVEDELRRLSVVAFAMFNRGAQWVTEAELDADLAALLFGSRRGRPARRPARAAAAGRGACSAGSSSSTAPRRCATASRCETYEFLHATFGEYLVARLTALVVDDLVTRRGAASLPLTGEPVEDDLLHALLSYAVLSSRATVLGFIEEKLRDDPYRVAWVDLLAGLFRAAPYVSGRRRSTTTAPVGCGSPRGTPPTPPTCCCWSWWRRGRPSDGNLFPEDSVAEWRAQVGLWRSQLAPEEWQSVSDLLALERLGTGSDRDVRLWLDGGLTVPLDADPVWALGASREAYADGLGLLGRAADPGPPRRPPRL